jgi:hypothetical protein
MNIAIQRVKVNELTVFIKKLLTIDKFIYFRIKPGAKKKDGPVIVANCYLPEKDAVKIQQVSFADIFESDAEITKNIKISFFDGSYVIDALKHFGQSVSGEIVCKEIGEDLVATSINLVNDDLNISIRCTDPSLGFQDLTSDQIKNIFSTDSAVFNFDVDYFKIEELKGLFSLEKEKETFKIAVTPTGIRFKGDVYNKLVNAEVVVDKEVEVMFYKKYLNLFDKESYNITICPSKAVFKSQDSNTMITIASCQSE